MKDKLKEMELWLETAKFHAGDDWMQMNQDYSFIMAYRNGLGPLEAVVEAAAEIPCD